MTVELYEALASIPGYDADLEHATGSGPAPVRRLRRRVAAVDGLLIASPEYNHSMPGVLKNALDWLSRPAPEEVLARKPIALVGASSGPWGSRLAQAALRQVLYATGSHVLPAPALYLRDAGALFDGEGRLVDHGTRERLSEMLSAFGHWITAVSSALYGPSRI
jgi:chromate reductase